MTDETEGRTAVPAWIKILLGVGLVVFLYLQGTTLLGPGGIMSKYTFMEGFTKFDDVMLDDPLSKAGFIDLMVLMAGFAIILIEGLPRGRYFPLLLAGFLIAHVIYPGLAMLAFLLLFWKTRRQFTPR